MIKGFACKITKQLWDNQALKRKDAKKFGNLDLSKALERLRVLNEASEKDLMLSPSMKYHSLGDGRFSIDTKRNSKWRVIFRWEDEEKTNVVVVRISSETH